MTRGTTAPNRLRRIDRWIAATQTRALRSDARPLAVDLGYGASPVTTLELHARLRAVAPRLEVVGIEIEPARVAAGVAFLAQAGPRAGLSFARGGFELPVPRPPVLVRAFNVLRQYGERRPGGHGTTCALGWPRPASWSRGRATRSGAARSGSR
ncbi:hypothetical protein [Actinomadura madurae]|uniref:hypothetical protein n=1 Tax=Actinomadura madurae TaxID=1993 RepID=UPI0020D24736|nr:hypothetical protein [Actinomadura madurae]MCP9969934.1 hypothetical protein [Actinomadura madurae]MCP9982383.1 hypothetical protein [Actinomadura madurae]